MGKTSELDLAIQELRSAAKSLNAVADSLTTLFSGNERQTVPEPESEVPKKPEVTLETVRAVLAEKSRSGLTAKVKALLEKHGASRLSDIDPAEYSALLEEAEVLQ